MVDLDDRSYHSDRINRMKFSGLDPSLALVRWKYIRQFIWLLSVFFSKAFACKTENEFEDLINKLKQVDWKKNMPFKLMICLFL